MAYEMSNLRKDYVHIPEAPTYRQVSISVCTPGDVANIRGFMGCLVGNLGEKIKEVRYQQLPHSDIHSFSLKDKDIDVMILCHSIRDRRFAITDVTDAIYTNFLLNAAKELGQKKVGVIVHDLPLEKIINDDEYESQMMTFRHQQFTTFKCASLVEIAGRLDVSPPELSPGTWFHIEDFLAKASRLSEQSPARALRNSLPCALLVLLIMATVLTIGLAVGLKKHQFLSNTTPAVSSQVVSLSTNPMTPLNLTQSSSNASMSVRGFFLSFESSVTPHQNTTEL